MKYINDEFLEKVKNNKYLDITKLERQLVKKQVLYDLKDIEKYIKKSIISKYGIYIYFNDNLNLYSKYDFISYREFRDINNYYKYKIDEIKNLIKEEVIKNGK